MSKVTAKLQVSLPRAIAKQYGIVPGSQVQFQPAGPVIVLQPAAARGGGQDLSRIDRLALFDSATRRQAGRDAAAGAAGPEEPQGDRGWTRGELHDRGLAR